MNSLRLSLAFLVTSPLFAACGDSDSDQSLLQDAAAADAAADAALDAAVDAAPESDAFVPPPWRVFVHPLENCSPGGLFNCTPKLELCADGTAGILVTDIANVGTYTEDSMTVISKWPAADVPTTVVFTKNASGDILVDDYLKWDWTLVPDAASEFCAQEY